MKRQSRLRQSNDIQRVRRLGRSYAHLLVVLVAFPSLHPGTRIGVIAGSKVGKAVERNRAKRRIRACMDQLCPQVTQGWDMVIFARHPICQASFVEIRSALMDLLRRAKLLETINGD